MLDRVYFFFLLPRSSLGAVGGRSAWFFACFALCASLLPDEFFFGFLSPMVSNLLGCWLRRPGLNRREGAELLRSVNRGCA